MGYRGSQNQRFPPTLRASTIP
ncbi:protein of unknown function [Streptomyces murinus]